MINVLADFNINEIWNNFLTWITNNGLKAVLAFIGLVVVWFIINMVTKAIRNRMRKSKKDEVVVNAVYTFSRRGLKALAIVIFLAVLGINMAAITSLLAALGVAIGLAVQGALSNVAGWFIIIVSRPFKLGDFIEADGVKGSVEEISIIYTHLKTPDNKVIFMPNGSLSNGKIINYSAKDTRRVEITVGISYKNDPQDAIKIMRKLISSHPLVHKDPEPFVRISNYGESSIDILCRFWVNNKDYWQSYYDVLNKVKSEFDRNGIEIPFNQLDVNLDKIQIEVDNSSKSSSDSLK